MAKCWHYTAIDSNDKVNCPNCEHWGGEKCKDEALLLATWQERYGSLEWMMRENKGVRVGQA